VWEKIGTLVQHYFQAILEWFFDGKPIPEDYFIVKEGEMASKAYTKGDATKGSH